MESKKELIRLKSSVEQDLLKLKGVTGVGVGEKISKGKRTGKQCIRVYVAKKLPKSKVSASNMIPEEVNGVPTDVIERKFELHTVAVKTSDLRLQADTGTYDPLTGGISIGPCRSIEGYVYVGTLGLVVEDNDTGDKMMLSNFHVMCVDDGWAVGDTMAQPSLVDTGSCPADQVGTLARASLGGQVDAAVAWITDRDSNCRITDIGEVTGKATVTLDEQVRKRGRTTELTHGFVDDISLTVTIDYGDGLGSVTLTNQIGMEVDSSQSTQFGNNGDSGSVVVNANSEVVGLYFAGTSDGSYGVANPIDAVLSALDIRLCTPGDFGTIFETPGDTLLETGPIGEHTWIETSPFLDYGGFTINKRFDDVKNPAGYDTLMETVQEHFTLREHGGDYTIYEGIQDPIPGGEYPPFVLSTPHHASGAKRFDTPSQPDGGQNIDEEIDRLTRCLRELKAKKRRTRS